MAEPFQVQLHPAAARGMADEVRHALTAERPWLPCKYFYDDRGSALFERITLLPEYYQTRTEEALLARIADDVIRRAADHVVGDAREQRFLGAGLVVLGQQRDALEQRAAAVVVEVLAGEPRPLGGERVPDLVRHAARRGGMQLNLERLGHARPRDTRNVRRTLP